MNRFVVALSFASCVALAFAAGCSSSSGSSSSSDQCFKSSGSGSTQICDSVSSTTPDYTCTGGTASGSCPSSGLFGCCVTTVTDGSYSTTSAICYYDKTDTVEMKACASPSKWVTSAP